MQTFQCVRGETRLNTASPNELPEPQRSNFTTLDPDFDASRHEHEKPAGPSSGRGALLFLSQEANSNELWSELGAVKPLLREMGGLISKDNRAELVSREAQPGPGREIRRGEHGVNARRAGDGKLKRGDQLARPDELEGLEPESGSSPLRDKHHAEAEICIGVERAGIEQRPLG